MSIYHPPQQACAAVEDASSRSAAVEASADAAISTQPFEAAHRSWAAWITFLLVAVVGLTLDLWTKHWAFHSLRQGGREVIVPNVLEFQTMLNRGALFGIGGGMTTVFLVASVFALGLVAWMFVQSSARRWTLHVALGAILAGALGNMYDRSFVRLVDRPFRSAKGPIWMCVTGNEGGLVLLSEYPPHEGALAARERPERLPGEVGFVRDFIKIPTRWFGDREIWPWVFNVADMLLVGGVSILAIHLLFDRGRHPNGAPAPGP